MSTARCFSKDSPDDAVLIESICRKAGKLETTIQTPVPVSALTVKEGHIDIWLLRVLTRGVVPHPLCGTTDSDVCTFEHAELNCASCSNSITPASTQVPHWSHSPLDWVIQAAVHFIVYTPRNGDICKNANKNIPAARNAPGISSPTPGYDSLSALVCFHSTALCQRVDIDPVRRDGVVFLLNGWHWKHGSLQRPEPFQPEWQELIGELFERTYNPMLTWMETRRQWALMAFLNQVIS